MCFRANLRILRRLIDQLGFPKQKIKINDKQVFLKPNPELCIDTDGEVLEAEEACGEVVNWSYIIISHQGDGGESVLDFIMVRSTVDLEFLVRHIQRFKIL